MSAAAATTCPTCGTPIRSAASEGLCPRCLVAGVLARRELPAQEGEVDTTVTRAGFPRPFGDYELLERIAQGGMGVVYRARHTGLNRVVALKMLREGRLAGPAAIRRFLLEAEAAGRLDHPNIVPIYEVGEHNGRHYFTMRLVEGGSLAGKVGSNQSSVISNQSEAQSAALITGSLVTDYSSPRLAAALLCKISRAVHFAHERGILHRDLKPANILLDAQGEPLVSDFGLAKLTESGSSSGLTLSGTVVGTPAYMAPEQAAGTSAQHTTAGDIYSLGAILYHLLAGKPPFEGASPLETMRMLTEQDPVPPSRFTIYDLRFTKPGGERRVNRKSKIVNRIDRDLDTICLKCLEKDPARRYATAAALADDLERWLRHEPIEARQTPPWEKAAKWMRRRPALTALLAVTLVSVAAFLAQRLDSEARLKRERDQVVLSERRAVAAAGRAAEEARRAETNEINARLNLYASDIFLAQRALDDGNLGLARRALQGLVPRHGQADLRGFEWRHLWRLSRGDDALALAAHAKAVTCLAFSRDGATLVTGGRDGRIRFWNTRNGTPGLVFPPATLPDGGEDKATLAAVFAVSPEVLALVASGGESLSGASLRSRSTTLQDVTTVALSPDGQWLASGSAGSFVRVWSVADQQLRFVVPVSGPRQLAFSPDSRHLIVGEGGGSKKEAEASVRIYDLSNRQRVQTMAKVTGHFASSPDGRALAVAPPNWWLELRDPASGATLRRWPADEAVHELAWSPDGRWIAAVGSSRRDIHLWSADTGERAGRFTVPSERVWAIAFSPDGATLATVGADHAVRLWDVAGQTERRSLRGHGDEVLAVAFSPTGDLVASAGKDLSARLWPARKAADEDGWEEARQPVAVTRDGRRVATRSDDGRIRLCDVAERNVAVLPDGPPRAALGFIDEDQTLVTLERAAPDAAPLLRHWNPIGEPRGKPLEIAEVPEGKISTPVSAAPGAGLGAFAVGKGNVFVFRLDTGAVAHRLNWQRREASWLQLSPDGRHLLGVSWPNRARLWNLASGQPVADWVASEGVVQRVACSPDSRVFATAGDDNRITLWDAATAARVTELRGHKAEVSALAFTPDGRTLASASIDLTLKLWHVPTWRELGTLRREKLFTFLAFAGEGPVLFAGEYRKALHLFPASAAESTPSAQNTRR